MGPKMTHFWVKNGSKMGQKMAQKWLKNDPFWDHLGPKTSYDIGKIGPKMAQKRGPKKGSKMGPKWVIFDPSQNPYFQVPPDPSRSNVRTVVFRPKRPKPLKNGSKWVKNGSKMTHFWPKSGQKMVKKGGPLLRQVPARSNVISVHFGQKGLKKGVHF